MGSVTGVAITEPSVQNTRSRRASPPPPPAVFWVSVSAGGWPRTAANTYDLALVPPSAGDDPVNETDPSGLASTGSAPPPTPSATAYDYSFDLGDLGSPQNVASFVHADCAQVFPISGCIDNFYQGEDMPLQTTFAFGLYTQSFPVQVVTAASTWFQFVALPGHLEGNGRTITFSFTGSSCSSDVELSVYTSSNGSIVTQWPGIRTIDFWVAHQTWAQFSNNIKFDYQWSGYLYTGPNPIQSA